MTIDRRIRKSQIAIRDAFIELLQHQQLEQVTVQQIADLADVNRSTFYTHYYDKYDLLEKLEDQQLEEIKTFINDNTSNEATGLSADNIYNIMKILIGNIEENIPFYQLMFRMGKDSNIHEKLYDLIMCHLQRYKNENDQINGIPFSYFMSYVSGAGLSLIRHWVEDPNRIDKVDLIRHFNTIVNQGPATIIKNIQ
ncbi:TetR/AcrR family transcriptional regulator [Staphylococcus argenteus]|uniref:TetR/AcrR family transcriptional regulator n=1 Tax=Staphylococcus argenteus TaxID=985002 RepID=UPI000504BA02|nr:TetR/AcrR family transcriptional regulator [Staphylococcus argenteus]MBE2133072.1 TetR/AcrR family transcriptional regulator C-terminal domain-containing protein [Staphylococcus argenteus]MBE2136889.1 TetR/AcrR family transcriptional regulator C-terminal domain-containing protein [Staphylococcus argenteus]MBE2147088.1 TetR/AcrR family transcriptional regulator C-terminal domain-containing protein [Staphylococcus argenteus]MBE2161788.1 TetR/AcrR family transcriptional regulator C-terminal dom